MTLEAGKYTGNLALDGIAVILETENGRFCPIPLPAGTRMSGNALRAITYNKFKDYIGREITISGYLQDNFIYDARVIRTPQKPDERPKPIDYGEEYWNNRVPKADVLFTARKLPGYDLRFAVDVRQLITINDSVIHKDLEDNSLMVENPNKCDDDIYGVYYHSRVKKINPYVYEYDNKAFGCEFFMYPYELRQVQKGDCDDWGIELASYLISAGVPEWRVRCVVGRTNSGGGHLTVYVLADDLKTWYHLNSTSPWWSVEQKGYKKLTDFPKSGDPDDQFGIKDVYFSFNNKYAWHAFETGDSEIEAMKMPWMRNVNITPQFD